MESSKNREIRKELYKAWTTKASEGEFDNSSNIENILKLRQEKAEILGYKNHAEVSLATKMANTVEEIYDLHETMIEPSMSHAKTEFSEISDFAAANGFSENLKAYDLSFWSKD